MHDAVRDTVHDAVHDTVLELGAQNHADLFTDTTLNYRCSFGARLGALTLH